MAISQPYLLGTQQADSAHAATVTAAQSTTAGDLIVACTDGFTDSNEFPGSPVSVTDTAGNTYTQASGAISNSVTASVWYAENTAALTGGTSTITATWSSYLSGQFNLTVIGCTGVALANALDQVATNYTTGSTMTAATGNLGLSVELAVASWVSRQAQGAPTVNSDWNSIAAFQGAGNTHYDNVAWQITTTASPVTATASTPSAGTGWAVTLVTFRGQLHPTAMLSCGGSETGYPVRTIDATALLGCGGSIVQPGALGPQPPFDPYPPPPLPAFIAGYGPQQADFGGWVQESFGYITGQMLFRAQQQVAQSISATTFTPVTFDTVLEDNFGGWSAVPTASQPANSWLAPYSGWFRVIFRFTCAAGSHWLDAAISVSGGFPLEESAGVLGPSAQPGGAGCSVIIPMIGGTDYVQLMAWGSTTLTTLVANPGVYSYVEIIPVQTDLSN